MEIGITNSGTGQTLEKLYTRLGRTSFDEGVINRNWASGVFQQRYTYAVNHHQVMVLEEKEVGGSDIQLISVVKQIFFPDKYKRLLKII